MIESDVFLPSYERPYRVLTEQDWEQVCAQADQTQTPRESIQKSLQKGIPSRLRGQIWAYLSGSAVLAAKFSMSTYEKLSSDTSSEFQINKDIRRSFPHQEFFNQPENQQSLKRVLQAYSAYDQRVSYQQGIGFIAGTLLTQMPEHMAFWTLVTIMYNHDWRWVFIEGTPKLTHLVHVLEQMIQKTLNDIYQHLDQEGIMIHGAFAHYFISIITYNVPLSLSCKVLDQFFYEGQIVIFDILLKALRSKQHKILQMRDEWLNKYLREEILNDLV